VVTGTSLIEAEALDLARLAGAAYQRTVAWYRAGGSTPDAADTLARAPMRYAVDAPSWEVSWLALNTLLDNDPQLATAIWERVKRDAAGYIEQGSMIAETLAHDTPWGRAQFYAVLSGFEAEWQPRGGMERALLGTMAQAFCASLYWAGQVQQRGTTDPDARTRAGWELPTQRQADALQDAAGLCDRFNRIMIRTLRAMRDLRRYTGPLTINNPQQVNIGAQQINTTRGVTDATSE
jgi:hypothetical protein